MSDVAGSEFAPQLQGSDPRLRFLSAEFATLFPCLHESLLGRKYVYVIKIINLYIYFFKQRVHLKCDHMSGAVPVHAVQQVGLMTAL